VQRATYRIDPNDRGLLVLGMCQEYFNVKKLDNMSYDKFRKKK